LELGCGAGNLWLENLDRLPGSLEIDLSDFSSGMLLQARFNLSKASTPFKFKVIDAQSIPFESQCFDVVIANHMLYHVPDIRRALLEIKRVLKPDGRFYASTIGESHLKEMHDLVTRFDPELPSWGTLPLGSFTLDNGADQLSVYFEKVSSYRYVDSLVVTDAGLLVDYILSGRLKISPDQKSDLAKFVEKEFDKNGGQFFIAKESGVFESAEP
jgi:SAM-dependent methyltransferase